MFPECSKTTPGSGCEIISEGTRLHMKIQTITPTLSRYPSPLDLDPNLDLDLDLDLVNVSTQDEG